MSRRVSDIAGLEPSYFQDFGAACSKLNQSVQTALRSVVLGLVWFLVFLRGCGGGSSSGVTQVFVGNR